MNKTLQQNKAAAQKIYDGSDESEKHGYKFGLFPVRLQHAIFTKEISVELMRISGSDDL